MRCHLTADSNQPQPLCPPAQAAPTHLRQLSQAVQRVDVGRGQPLVPAAGRHAGTQAALWVMWVRVTGLPDQACRGRQRKAGITSRQGVRQAVHPHSSRQYILQQHSPHHAVVVQLDLLHSPQRRLQHHAAGSGACGKHSIRNAHALVRQRPPAHAAHAPHSCDTAAPLTAD